MRIRVRNKAHSSSLKSKVFYRGIEGNYSKEHEKRNQPVVWITTDKKYAELYGDNIITYTANIRNSFDLHFRSTLTYVKYSDVTKRVKQEILKMFRTNSIAESKAKALIARLTKGEDKNKGKLKRVWEWWTNNDDLVQVLLRLGFDSIRALEGKNDSTVTFGIIDKSILHIRQSNED